MTPRILVVGGLAAGPSAASKAKRTNPKADVTLFEQGEDISYGICEIPYYLGGTITDPSLLTVYTPERLKKEKGVTALIHHRVEELHTAKKILSVRNLESGKVREHRYDRLILAMGSSPKALGLKGEESRNVFSVKTLDGAFALKKFIDTEKPRRAVIIGAGYIGMEMAEALTSCRISTTVIHRGAAPMSKMEPACRAAIGAVLKSNGVRFVSECMATELTTDQVLNVTKVRTTKGDFECDLVIVAVGVSPNSDLAAGARIRRGAFRGIRTDQRQMTSVDGVYAAGDCCEVRNLVNRSWMYIPLATVASRQGWVAGENAAGGRAEFRGAIRALGVKIFGLHVAQLGLNSKEASDSGFNPQVEQIEGNSRIGFFPGNAKVTLIAIRDRKSNVILGANVFGEDGVVQRANVLSVAIQQKMTVDQLRDLDLLYAPPFSPLWDPVLVLANQMRKNSLR